jgi:hypothetical protein
MYYKMKDVIFFHNIVGLKRSKLVLFPFWFLISKVLTILGNLLTKLVQKQLNFSNLGFILNWATNLIMISQILSYRPFELI